MIKCPDCGFVLNGNEEKCPNCGYVLKQEGAGVTPPPPEQNNPVDVPPPPVQPENNSVANMPGGKKPVPFADPSIPFFDGLFETVKLALFSPSKFFKEYDFSAQMGQGILFALIMGVVSGVFSFIYNLVFRGSLYSMLAKWGNIPAKEMQMQSMFAVFGGIMGIILIPIAVVMGLFIMGGIYHLLLMIVNGAKNGFESTVNVLAYTSSVLVLAIIPICGSMIGGIYRIILNIIGLAEVHETTTGKASFAVLLPYLLCCLCVVIYAVFLFGIIGLAASQH